MGGFDATDEIDKANTVTSNIAAILRAAVNAGEAGVHALLAQAMPYAEQLDALFGDANEPVPAPPSGGVPVDTPLSVDDAATTIGV